MKQEYCSGCGYPIFPYDFTYHNGAMEPITITAAVDGRCGDPICGARPFLRRKK